MNTRTPLAAALLLISASAVAQPLAPNAGTFGGGSSNSGFSLGSMTDPAGAFGPTQFLGTSPDVQWADPKCNFIPCNTVASAKAGKDQAALEKRMAEQKRLTPNDTIVDMGDGKSFGIIFVDDKGNKTISIDNGSSCGMPRALSPEEETKFAAQIAKGESKKADQAQVDKSINGDKNGMKINSAPPINEDHTEAGDTASGTTPPAGAKGSPSPNIASAPPSGGYQDGRSLGDQANAFGGGSDSPGGDGGDSSVGGGGFGGGSRGGPGGNGDTTVASKAISYAGSKAKAEAEAGGITHIGLLGHQANIERLGKAFQGGQIGELSSPNAPASGRLAEPPTTPETVGKMQFGANSAPADGK